MTGGNPVGLVEFLLARLGDKAAAVQPFVNDLGVCRPWRTDEVGGAVRTTPVLSGDDGLIATCGTHIDAVFIADNDPAYVLQDIAAKRRIIELHFVDAEGYCDTCVERHPCPTLRHLAAPFSSHPDWQPEWNTE